jgi:hypothetical protein
MPGTYSTGKLKSQPAANRKIVQPVLDPTLRNSSQTFNESGELRQSLKQPLSGSVTRKMPNDGPRLNRLPLKGQDEGAHHHHNQSANLFMPINDMGLGGYGSAGHGQQ